ncbi:hypothetical protein FOMPIDRAFT_1056345 [Fomitopsis schrenkii]|uniref:C2H2-type domain-containing protein n=1 Tax=Fomitopsis schrenkii TaxID=2126942 RepID=S8DHL2_FOMSC|nr:hypothetical protein FOMPIDRAFT_1056345 [Fomitopsis schrenkii]
MAKKKNRQIIRPWCWYCEREFEDEKVLMQHQKAKHFKCNMCPRRLNTAGGLAVHIQQVHKLEPDQLPLIDNALPGWDGYEVEIFGMEGIPAPDVADYKRRKEIELGLNPGTISQPQSKRPKLDNRALTEEELRAQLQAHKALMGASERSAAPTAPDATGAVFGAPPQAYSAPPVPAAMPPPSASPPAYMPPGAPPFALGGLPPPGFQGMLPFPPPPGMSLPLGMPPPGYPMQPPFAGSPPPGMPMPGAPGAPPFPMPPGMRLPFPPPPFLPPGMTPPPGFSPPGTNGLPPSMPPTPMPPGASPPPGVPGMPPPIGHLGAPQPPARHGATPLSATHPPVAPPLTLPNPSLAQTNPPFKKATVLKWDDPNFSPEEKRATDPKYYFPKESDAQKHASAAAQQQQGIGEESRGKKRARAEDFL